MVDVLPSLPLFTFLNTRCSFYLCGVAALLCLVEGLLQQVIKVLHDVDEDTDVVHRLDQLENHDGLRAPVEVDVVFSSFLFEVPCSKIVVPETAG